jgi:four helix bundle protein
MHGGKSAVVAEEPEPQISIGSPGGAKGGVLARMSKVNSYRDLVAWQKAMDLVVEFYRESAKLPLDERFGLRAQLRRCAIGIPSNIAEGWGRRSAREYVRFLRMAMGSTFELLTQAEISERLGFEGDWGSVRLGAQEVGRILNALMMSISERHALPPPGP